jgi:uncharacterized membrane protein
MSQYIGEFFLVMLILFIFSSNNKNIKVGIMSITFSFSIIISHYGTAYLFLIFFLIGGFILYKILKIRPISDIYENSSISNSKFHPLFNLNFIIIYIIMVFSWYAFTSMGSNLQNIVFIGRSIFDNLSNLFIPISQSAQLQMAAGATISSVWRQTHWLIFMISVVFIIIGIFQIVFNPNIKKFKFKNDWIVLNIAGLFIILLSLVLSNFAIYYNVNRLYHLTLIFLSPLYTIGLIQLVDTYYKFKKRLNKNRKRFFNKNLKYSKNAIFSIIIIGVLIPNFLFNTGLVYELVGDTPSSVPLSSESYISNKDSAILTNYYYWGWNDNDIMGAKWISNYKYNERIYGDIISSGHILRSYGGIQKGDITFITNNTVNNPGYFYLFELNVKKGIIPSHHPIIHNKKIFLFYSDFKSEFEKKNQIYSNGDTIIFKS